MTAARFVGILLTAGLVLLGTISYLSWSPYSALQWLTTCSHGASEFAPFRKSGYHQTHGTDATFLLGVGKADITGPVVEIDFMGYADPDQLGTGLRQRIYSRAFIIGSRGNPNDRLIYLVLDTQSGDTAIRYGILQGLAELGPDFSSYSNRNLAVTGTHSHSGPGAWLNYLLPQITSKGFNKQSYQAIVDGAVLSIKRAHESLQPGYLSIGNTTLNDTNISRSLYAYLANPAEERSKYADDVDKTLTLLRFTSAADGKDVGILTWFAVHGTSMYGNNTLVSGDNKGVAALMFEKAVQGSENIADGFVAGFSQSNVGDTSPNVLGAYCDDGSGQTCSFNQSLCSGKSETCHGRGPYFEQQDQGAASCFEIGRRQFVGAKALYDDMRSSNEVLQGDTVKSFHFFKDFSKFSFLLPNGSMARTCPAALGYSFAAGTTDGPGAFDFKQNDPNKPDANPLWELARAAIKEPSEAQMNCHRPKPILLDVGEITEPYQWTPNIVDIQVLRVGDLFIIVSPGEATTMSGRRWRNVVHDEILRLGLSDGREPWVLLGAPANSYTHYIATEEEYDIQRYEGASTLYGRHTLNAYINSSVSSLGYLASDATETPPVGPQPPDNVNKSLSFITGVVYDSPPLFKVFGDVLADTESAYNIGDTVEATFVAGNPRNDLRLEDTYAAVEKIDENGVSSRVRDDSDWALVFRWQRTNSVLGTSEAKLSWKIEDGTDNGQYRLVYFGASKAIGGAITQFEGSSSLFNIG